MGRRKQHYPKKSSLDEGSDNGDDQHPQQGSGSEDSIANEDEKKEQEMNSDFALRWLEHLQAAQQIALQAAGKEEKKPFPQVPISARPVPTGSAEPAMWPPSPLEVHQRLLAEHLIKNFGFPHQKSPKIPPMLSYPPLHPFGSRLMPRPVVGVSKDPGIANFLMRPMMMPPNMKPNLGPGEGLEHQFRCIWCQKQYSTLPELAEHLKEAKHGNVTDEGLMLRSDVGRPLSHSPPSTISSTSPLMSPRKAKKASIKGQNAEVFGSSKSPLSKESAAHPRKLVRGQDVWLGKGQEQTRQILKCMWCGASFKTLAELTHHMQETQHYTKVISQEQITSWRSQASSSSSLRSSTTEPPESSPPCKPSPQGLPLPPSTGAFSSTTSRPYRGCAMAGDHVAAVLSCRVCQKSYGTLKDLSNHLAETNHFSVERITQSPRQINQLDTKRRKSLPVRKLLEIERSCMGDKDEPVKPKRSLQDENNPHNYLDYQEDKILRPPSNGEATGSSILGSLERMVETSFTAYSNSLSSPPISEKGILHRLGMAPDQTPGSGAQTPSDGESGSLTALKKMVEDDISREKTTSSPGKIGDVLSGTELTESATANGEAFHQCGKKRRGRKRQDEGRKKKKPSFGEDGEESSSLSPSSPASEDRLSPAIIPKLGSNPGGVTDSTESKFFKYSALARELSGKI